MHSPTGNRVRHFRNLRQPAVVYRRLWCRLKQKKGAAKRHALINPQPGLLLAQAGRYTNAESRSNLCLDSLYLENHRLDPVSTTRDEIAGVFHPSGEIPLEHQDHKDFVDVIPGPITLKTFGPYRHIVHCEFLPYAEERARTLVHVCAAIFFRQFFVVQRFQHGDPARGERWHGNLLSNR